MSDLHDPVSGRKVGALFGANWRGKVRQSTFSGTSRLAHWRSRIRWHTFWRKLAHRDPTLARPGGALEAAPLSGRPASAFVASWRIVALPNGAGSAVFRLPGHCRKNCGSADFGLPQHCRKNCGSVDFGLPQHCRKNLRR
jgi:hypothetical protein